MSTTGHPGTRHSPPVAGALPHQHGEQPAPSDCSRSTPGHWTYRPYLALRETKQSGRLRGWKLKMAVYGPSEVRGMIFSSLLVGIYVGTIAGTTGHPGY